MEYVAYVNTNHLDIIQRFGGHPWQYKDWPSKKLVEFFEKGPNQKQEAPKETPAEKHI